MRYLKSKVLSGFSANDQTLFVNQFGRAVMNVSGGLRLPKGTTNERPQPTYIDAGNSGTSVRTLGGPNGYIRYNTDTESVEAYIDGVWEIMRSAGSTAITKQTLGGADDVETAFGPMTITPTAPDVTGPGPNAEYVYPIIVLVENVMQIQTTNYEILTNYTGINGVGTYIQFTSPVPTGKNITIFYGYGN